MNGLKNYQKHLDGKDGNQKAKVLIFHDGSRAEEWERDSDGNEKAKFLILPNGNRIENWTNKRKEAVST